jgi:hypothetical protein
METSCLEEASATLSTEASPEKTATPNTRTAQAIAKTVITPSNSVVGIAHPVRAKPMIKAETMNMATTIRKLRQWVPADPHAHRLYFAA